MLTVLRHMTSRCTSNVYVGIEVTALSTASILTVSEEQLVAIEPRAVHTVTVRFEISDYD